MHLLDKLKSVNITPDKFNYYLSMTLAFALMLAIAITIGIGLKQYLNGKNSKGKRGVVATAAERKHKRISNLTILGVFTLLVVFAHTPFYTVSNKLVTKLDVFQDKTTTTLTDHDKSGTDKDLHMTDGAEGSVSNSEPVEAPQAESQQQ